MTNKYLAFFIFCGCFHRLALAQTAPAGPAPSAAVLALTQQYQAAFPVAEQLYNGPEYHDYSKRYLKSVGSQFFASAEKQPGTIYYNNRLFTGIELAYDVVLDQIVLKYPLNPLELQLINERVGGFTLGDHRFIRLVADSDNSVVSTGYYEVLADNGVQFLARRKKRLHQQVSQGRTVAEFLTIDELFIKKGQTYYRVGSKGSATRPFADRSKEIQKYVRDNKLKFDKKSREASITQLTQYYSTLPPQ
jgi:hypothetical protein